MAQDFVFWLFLVCGYPWTPHLFCTSVMETFHNIGTSTDWIVMVVYFLAIMLFGSYFGRYTKTTSDFFFGGRRFSWWLITMSIVATGVGSHSFVKYSAKAVSYTWVQFHYDLYERLVFCSLFHVWVVTNIGVFEGPFHPGIF